MAPVLPIAKASSLSILHLPQLVPPGACPSGWTPARAASTRRPRRGTGQRLAPLCLLVRLRCTLVTSMAPVHQNNSIRILTTGVRGAGAAPGPDPSDGSLLYSVEYSVAVRRDALARAVVLKCRATCQLPALRTAG